MRKLSLCLFTFVLLSCSTTRYYIVRHAEKAQATTMSSDVPLSESGRQRAAALKEALQHQNIMYIFSTPYQRTIATAQPLSTATGIRIQPYQAAGRGFIDSLKTIKKGNVLIVGHSNTVDDLVNGLMGKQLLQDLPDSAYGDLFIITKHGPKYQYSKAHFGL